MKPFRSTAVLSIVVIGIAGYTYWDFKKAAAPAIEGQEAQTQLFTFSNDKVTGIKIESATETIEMEKEGDVWTITKPLKDMGESTAIDSFLYLVLAQQGKAFRDEEISKTTPKWEEFGLAPPGLSLSITSDKGTETLQVSSKNAYDGSYYIRHKDQLMLGDQGLAQLANRSSDSFRSRQLWRNPDVEVVRAEAVVNMDNLKSRFKIVRSGDKWTLDPEPEFTVDTEKVANWLIRVQELDGHDIIKDNPSPEDKKNALLLRPSSVVSLFNKDKDGKMHEWVLAIGQDKAEDVFIKSTERPTIYKVPTSSVAKIRVPLEFFRDGKKPFRFPVDLAHKVEVNINGELHTFIKKGSTWSLDESVTKTDKQLNQDKLVALIQKIAGLEAQEFLRASTSAGFTPEQRIVIRDGKDEVLLDLQWGKPFISTKDFNKGVALTLAKTNLEKEILAIPTAQLQNLIDPKLLEKKAAKK